MSDAESFSVENFKSKGDPRWSEYAFVHFFMTSTHRNSISSEHCQTCWSPFVKILKSTNSKPMIFVQFDRAFLGDFRSVALLQKESFEFRRPIEGKPSPPPVLWHVDVATSVLKSLSHFV